MRKAVDACLAALFGYAAVRAFGHEDYAGVYFHGLAASFAAADLLKASLGKKEFISPSDFSSPSVALISAATTGVSVYALTAGSVDLKAPALKDTVDVALSGVVRDGAWLLASSIGLKILCDRITKPDQLLSSTSNSDGAKQDVVPPAPKP